MRKLLKNQNHFRNGFNLLIIIRITILNKFQNAVNNAVRNPYNYNQPDLKTINGFLRHLVVILNKNRTVELRTNNYRPEFAFTLSDNRFQPGRYTINQITIASNEATFVPGELDMKQSGENSRVSSFSDEAAASVNASFTHTNTKSFSFKFEENVAVKADFKVRALDSFDVIVGLNTGRNWTISKTNKTTTALQRTTTKETGTKTIYNNGSKKGYLKAKIDPNLKIKTFFTRLSDNNNHLYQRLLSLKDFIAEVKRIEGNADLFASDPLIIKEGNDLFLNIPVEVEFSNTTVTKVLQLCIKYNQ